MSGFEFDKPKGGTNIYAHVECKTCNGDRMVVFSERSAPNGFHEEYAPCPSCNPDANTRRFGYRSPSQDRVRERLARQ